MIPDLIQAKLDTVSRAYEPQSLWEEADVLQRVWADDLCQLMRAGYAVMFDLPEAQRKELERKHIRLVQLPASGDRTGQLAAWLNSLT